MNTYDELRRGLGWGLMATPEQVADLFGFGDRIPSFNRLMRESGDLVFVELRKIKVQLGRTAVFPTRKVAAIIDMINTVESKTARLQPHGEI